MAMLTVPEVIWAAVSDERLDAHIRAHHRHRRVHCRRNPDAYQRDIASPQAAALACGGCPIVLACREQALRQEAGAGQCYGVRGAMTADDRARLIARRPASAARTILPSTWSRTEVIEHLASRGYVISANTWSAKAHAGNAPRPVFRHGGRTGSHWDVREVRAFDPANSKVNQHD